MATDFGTNSRDEAIALAAVGGLLGAALLYFGLKGGAGGGDQHRLHQDETMSAPLAPGIVAGAQLHLALGAPLRVTNPTVQYSGPGRRAYTYLQVKQGGVTVYGSGIADVFLGPANAPTTYPLVPADEVQCNGTPGPLLTAYPWNGVDPCGQNSVPICGRQPAPGPADVWLEIYEDSSESGFSNDGVGFSPAPTCATPPRTHINATIYPNAILFV